MGGPDFAHRSRRLLDRLLTRARSAAIAAGSAAAGTGSLRPPTWTADLRFRHAEPASLRALPSICCFARRLPATTSLGPAGGSSVSNEHLAPAISQFQSLAARSVPHWIDIRSDSPAGTLRPTDTSLRKRNPAPKNRSQAARSTAVVIYLRNLGFPSEALIGGDSSVRKNQPASLAAADHMFNSARQKLAGDGPIIDLAGSLKVIPGDLN